MKRISKRDWEAVHRDYRGEVGGAPAVLVLDRDTGATTLQPVVIQDHVAPEECGHLFLAILGTDGWAGECYAACRTCGVAGPAAHTSGAARRAFWDTYGEE